MFDLLSYRLEAQAYAGQALTGLSSFVVDNPGATLAGTVGILGFLAVVGVMRRVKTWHKKGNTMAERKAQLAQLYADHIHSLMFGLLHSGKISNQEYRRDLQDMAKRLGLSDLKRVSLHKGATRARVSKNVSSVKLLDASGVPIQPRIPGPKPAEVVPVPQSLPSKRKQWIAQGKSMLRVKAA